MKTVLKKISWYVVLLSSMLFFIDFITKYLTQKYILPIAYSSIHFPFGGIAVFQDFLGIDFSINYLSNTGAAWGIFSQFPIILMSFRIACVLGMGIYLLFFNKNVLLIWPFSLIIVGAVGNIIDYFIYGYVIDMLKFEFWGYHYPIFNFADTYICIGMLWLVIDSIFIKRKTIK